MNALDLFGLSFDALRERKLRASLTIAMVVIGAGLVTALNGMSTGMYEYMTAQFGTLGANVIIVLPRSQFRLNEMVHSNLDRIQDVRDAVPFIQQITTIESGGSSKTVPVIGMDQTKLQLIFPAMGLDQGKFVSPYNSIGILLGYTIANPPGESSPFARVGQSVVIKYAAQEGNKMMVTKRSFRVEGVVSYMGTSALFIPIDRMASISIAAANSLFDRGGNYDGFFVISKTEEAVERVVNDMRRLYGTNLEIHSAKTLLETIQNIMGSMQVFMGSIGAVSLVVAAVGILAALYTSVMERTKEIGLLKALGFKSWMVLLLFLNEAILIGMIGGLIGDGVGFLLGNALAIVSGQARSRVTETMRFGVGYVPPVFTTQSMIFVWSFCVALSIFAGVYPAWRASRLDPVVALRKE